MLTANKAPLSVRVVEPRPLVSIRTLALALLLLASLTHGCGRTDSGAEPDLRVGEDRSAGDSGASEDAPDILLITLDTTRADRIGIDTPNLDRLVERGTSFDHAYTTAPTTLPAHASILTGLYPSEHGIHENARYLDRRHRLLAENLSELGYQPAAFVSGLPLSRQFGLARGFDHYDDYFRDREVERHAAATTDRAIAYLGSGGQASADRPIFLWLHYYDPHDPYSPPEPFRSRFENDPYQGEIAFMDEQIGRLVETFESRSGRSRRIAVVGDHGEGLGDHGERLHGNLLYQEVMRVPLVVVDGAPGGGREPLPVSTRRLFDLISAWAEPDPRATTTDGPDSSSASSAAILAGGSIDSPQPALGEAMKPFLQYGWQPQVMSVFGTMKAIRSGSIEIYDLASDPDERENLVGRVELEPAARQALRAYPLPDRSSSESVDLSAETRRRLASLGYVDSGSTLDSRNRALDDAPSARDMTHLFDDLDAGSALFVYGDYRGAIARFERVLEQDPNNLMVAVRLAVSHSVLGENQRADDLFDRARRTDPESVDVRHYQAMHHYRTGESSKAEALFESVLARQPERLPALRALADIRQRQGRASEAAALVERVVARDSGDASALSLLGELRMASGDTSGAIDAFELARSVEPEAFRHNLELGACYLASQRLMEARDALDQIADSHPAWPMVLFKRAQVSVLLDEPDREARIRSAIQGADAITRSLIRREKLFETQP